MPPTGVTLRAQTARDREFLCALYASTRTEELAQVPWSEEIKQAFLRSQFEAQTVHYEKFYSEAELWIVERNGAPIGRIYVHNQDPDDVRIIDISLVPLARGIGVGGQLISDVLADAARAGKTASIHVERFNPAQRLYLRLGFELVGDQPDGIYLLMRWSGSGRVPTPG